MVSHCKLVIKASFEKCFTKSWILVEINYTPLSKYISNIALIDELLSSCIVARQGVHKNIHFFNCKAHHKKLLRFFLYPNSILMSTFTQRCQFILIVYHFQVATH